MVLVMYSAKRYMLFALLIAEFVALSRCGELYSVQGCSHVLKEDSLPLHSVCYMMAAFIMLTLSAYCSNGLHPPPAIDILCRAYLAVEIPAVVPFLSKYEANSSPIISAQPI